MSDERQATCNERGSSSPMTQNAMSRRRRGMIALGLDQLAATQQLEGGLNGAFRQTGFFGERPETRGHRFPSGARRLAVKPNENEIRGRLPIMSHNVAHQNIQ